MPNWTDAQLAAINSSARRILVSAAAGAGKTATLVERVLRRITGQSGEADITKFVIVTFTNAAAAEMREKLGRAIEQYAVEHPGWTGATRQIALLPTAEIKTINKYCLDLCRRHCAQLGLTADFRIADDITLERISADVLEDTLDEQYETQPPGGAFYDLVERVCGSRNDDRLGEIILDMWYVSQCWADADGEKERILSRLDVRQYDTPGESVWGRALLSRLTRQLSAQADIYARLTDQLAGDRVLVEKYLPAVADDAEYVRALLARAKQNSWAEICDLLVVPPDNRLSALPRGCAEQYADIAGQVKAAREALRKCLETLRGVFVAEDVFFADIAQTEGPAKELFRLLDLFETQLSERLRQRGLASFNDIERMALSLLTDGFDSAGQPIASQTAKKMGEQYEEILVDEYQDVTELQDCLFTAISAGGAALFLVGDVKQSIYRFRQANPGLFLHKYRSFGGGDGSERILLDRNFRSVQPILEATNFIFDAAMSETFGELDYGEDERLVRGRGDGDTGGERVRLDLIGADGGAADEDNDGDQPLSAVDREAHYIADCIIELMDNPAAAPAYGDIAVLLRNTTHIGRISALLTARGIPVDSAAAAGFLSAPEVLTITSLLSCIANPDDDILLLAAMGSPLFGYTAADLLALAQRRGGRPYYEYLRSLRGDEDELAARCRTFFSRLRGWRLLSYDLPVARLIHRIYVDTGATAIFSADSSRSGAARIGNLMRLIEIAGAYERQASRGLPAFLDYLAELTRQPEVSLGTGGVRVLTMHKSKGLEFPVVFLSRLHTRVNLRDTTLPVLLHREYGVALPLWDDSHAFRHRSALHGVISNALTDEQKAEELRLLYVSMTRAKEYLIMTAAAPSERAEAMLQARAQSPGGETYKLYSTMRDWLLLALMSDRAGAPFGIHQAGQSGRQEVLPADDRPSEDGQPTADAGDLSPYFDWIYPHQSDVNAPVKLTVTQLKGRNLDPEIDDGRTGDTGWQRKLQPSAFAAPLYETPQFVSGLRPVTPAQRGNAYHLAMQLIPLQPHDESSVAAFLGDMAARELITPQQCEAVRPRDISGFFATATGRELLGRPPECIWREFKFELWDDGELFAETAGGMLLQGVCDLFFIRDDGTLCVVDYKSDRVKVDETQRRSDEYAGQVRAYARALERITGRKVSKTALYYFACGIEIAIE